MNKLITSVSLSLCLLFSAAAFSADLPGLINSTTSENEARIGTVSVSGVRGSFDDAVRKLQEKSAALGGSKLKIIALGTPGDSSLWTGNAEVYK